MGRPPPQPSARAAGGSCSPVSLSSAPGCRCDQDNPSRAPQHAPWTRKPKGGLPGAVSWGLIVVLEPQRATWSQASL